MKKQFYTCKEHKLVLLQRYFTLINGQYFYIKQSRCYRCKQIIEEKMAVSVEVVNKYSEIKFRLPKIK
jgi:hypothetical protein